MSHRDAGSVQLRIGEAAELTEVSTRTLRWYEEIGLLTPAGHSAGGARRYSEDDLRRIVHIRELQLLVGIDLGGIGDILHGEDVLDDLGQEYRAGADLVRQREILLEARSVNERLRGVVAARQELLTTMMHGLDEQAARCAELLAGLDGGAV